MTLLPRSESAANVKCFLRSYPIENCSYRYTTGFRDSGRGNNGKQPLSRRLRGSPSAGVQSTLGPSSKLQ